MFRFHQRDELRISAAPPGCAGLLSAPFGARTHGRLLGMGLREYFTPEEMAEIAEEERRIIAGEVELIPLEQVLREIEARREREKDEGGGGG